jgi:hypothetical protein
MPILPKNPQVVKSLQIDRPRAFRVMSEPTPQLIKGLQRWASILRCLIKINGIVPSHTKRHLKVDEKRHFCLKVFCKKALLFNEKALLIKKFILKNHTNYLKRIKNKNALNGRAFCLWA